MYRCLKWYSPLHGGTLKKTYRETHCTMYAHCQTYKELKEEEKKELTVAVGRGRRHQARRPVVYRYFLKGCGRKQLTACYSNRHRIFQLQLDCYTHCARPPTTVPNNISILKMEAIF